MTKTEIKNIINETTTNHGIKWSVLKANKHEIVLTNDYVTSIYGKTREVFVVKHGVDKWDDGDTDEYVRVFVSWDVPTDTAEYNKDKTETIGYFYRWETRLDHLNDFVTIDDGLKMGVKCAVIHFDYCY